MLWKERLQESAFAAELIMTMRGNPSPTSQSSEWKWVGR